MIKHPVSYDVIVIGGGHAGTEAALAAARMGCKTLLLSHNIETIGQMSCNPAIGGIGKSHLVKEIDALGGAMAHAADIAGIHFKVLNSRRGPAVRATRAQADRGLYRNAIRHALERQQGLDLFQQNVTDLLLQGERVVGVTVAMGMKFYAQTVILTTGTFLAGSLHVGENSQQGGRAGDASAERLATRLREMPFRVGRLKTGTPPRIDAGTVNFACLEKQPGDVPEPVMSFLGDAQQHAARLDCHITATNETTHEIVRAGLPRSAMYSGQITGVGPRYCPSIEDKIVRFAERVSHQIFVEPEGIDAQEIYPNGISTSLPFDVQWEFVRSIKGFEQAHITRPGYAVEYDYFHPGDLYHTLETRFVKGLFFAGQINGTTGYEEAAAQGILAGINAALQVQEAQPWWPQRNEAYIGVLVDDLITRGVTEPYRMFTSRAEHRLLLREDNADQRLTPIGRQLGLVDNRRWQHFQDKCVRIEKESKRLATLMVSPGTVMAKGFEAEAGVGGIQKEISALDLLKRPQLDYIKLCNLLGCTPETEEVGCQLDISVKYQGYILRQEEEAKRLKKYETLAIPSTLDFTAISGLSNEVRQCLAETRPQTLGQASRLPGITPAAAFLLLIHIEKNARKGRQLAS